jgi:DUF2950 family protein
MRRSFLSRTRIAGMLTCVIGITAALSCRSTSPGPQTFSSPEEAVNALIAGAKRGTLDDLMKIFGPEVQTLVDSSDPRTARQNRQVFVAAAAEGWRLDENGPDSKLLIVGHESWPFPVPLLKTADRWHFDTANGVEEVLARRIGRNELAAIRACRTYVIAQRLYASRGHDGNPAGLYAAAFRSDPGRHNGLYWPPARGEKVSPLGDLIAQAADEGKSPFHGYRVKILKSPDPKGFALVAWPAAYDSTGVMTFVVSEDGAVREKDLGPETDRAVTAMNVYAVDVTWAVVQ